jgi:5-methylcytosine-specific restriction protein A
VASRPCRACRKALVNNRSGLCPACEPQEKTNWGKWQAVKGTAEQRGYGWRWKQVRKQALERDHYLCQECARRGVVTHATEVDHIIERSAGGTDELANLQSLCAPCHRAKTAAKR